MAEVSLVLACSHSGFLYSDPAQWHETRARRSQRANVPVDSVEENLAKFERCMQAFATLKSKLEAARPDVLLVFGDDQDELFHFDNLPAFGLYLGDEFSAPPRRGDGAPQGATGAGGIHIDARVKGCPPLARELLEGLMNGGFDLAFSTEMPEGARGMGHAFLRPGYYLTPGYPIPMIPCFINCYYAPQPRAERCFELGRAVRQIIDDSELDMRVAVIGSGGLWHTPGAPESYLDEQFDRTILQALETGKGRAAAV
ncbi:MAG TPA: hypothetical protein VGK54_02055, partial [Chloroflexota bacterium]